MKDSFMSRDHYELHLFLKFTKIHFFCTSKDGKDSWFCPQYFHFVR